MKSNLIKYLWVVILITLVSLLLATLMGYVAFDRFIGQKSFIIFTCLAAASFLSYFLSGIKNWAWLFPALICSALALNAASVFEDFGTPIVAFPILFAIAIPFYIAFLLKRERWTYLILAWLLTVIAIIPPLSIRINPDILAALVLYSVSLPFLVGCLISPRCHWALFMAAVLGFIGIFLLVEEFIHGDILGPVAMLLLTLPFFMVYYASKRHWWALIPSGIFITIMVIALLDKLLPAYDYIYIGDYQLGIYSGSLFLGLAATFTIIRRLHPFQATQWTRYPAIGFLAASILAFLMGENFVAFLPLTAVLVIGVVMASLFTLRKKVSQQPSS